MVELSYDEAYRLRHNELLDLVEFLERQDEPSNSVDLHQFEACLPGEDLARIIALRRRFPNLVEDRFIPPIFIQKALLLDGHYGESAQLRTEAMTRLTNDQALDLLKSFLVGKAE